MPKLSIRTPTLAAALSVACGAFSATFDERLDELSERLSYSTSSGDIRARLSGTIDIDYHAFEGSPPGLIDTTKSEITQPRLTLFLDAQAGPKWYGFAQARADRGFDPSEGGGRGRIDEYAIRFTPWEDGRLNLQFGQFSTVAGEWTKRHLSWDNPFVSAPLAYEQITYLSDAGVNYAGFPAAEVSDEWLYGYNPLIWGPSYASGVAASGVLGRFEWAVEAKNASLSSRPEYWSFADRSLDLPTYTARLAWRPDVRWTFGLSGTRGPYLDSSIDDYLYGNWTSADYLQQGLVFDASFEWRHLQVWLEAMRFEFDIPYGAEVSAWSGFIEVKYKFAPRLFAAVRINRQTHSQVTGWTYSPGPWGEDQNRLDLAVTARLNAHAQWQFEYDIRDSQTGLIDMGNRFATRFTLRF